MSNGIPGGGAPKPNIWAQAKTRIAATQGLSVRLDDVMRLDFDKHGELVFKKRNGSFTQRFLGSSASQVQKRLGLKLIGLKVSNVKGSQKAYENFYRLTASDPKKRLTPTEVEQILAPIYSSKNRLEFLPAKGMDGPALKAFLKANLDRALHAQFWTKQVDGNIVNKSISTVSPAVGCGLAVNVFDDLKSKKKLSDKDITRLELVLDLPYIHNEELENIQIGGVDAGAADDFANFGDLKALKFAQEPGGGKGKEAEADPAPAKAPKRPVLTKQDRENLIADLKKNPTLDGSALQRIATAIFETYVLDGASEKLNIPNDTLRPLHEVYDQMKSSFPEEREGPSAEAKPTDESKIPKQTKPPKLRGVENSAVKNEKKYADGQRKLLALGAMESLSKVWETDMKVESHIYEHWSEALAY